MYRYNIHSTSWIQEVMEVMQSHKICTVVLSSHAAAYCLFFLEYYLFPNALFGTQLSQNEQ